MLKDYASAASRIEEALLGLLACPHDHAALRVSDTGLECAQGHAFEVENGVPIFAQQPRREAKPLNMPPLPQISRSDDGLQEIAIDAFVNDWIVNTNGNLYWRARGRLRRYPIPEWPFGMGKDKTVLDIGCSWGRWSIAAARAGFQPIGLDVHFDALVAGSRVAEQFKANCGFICGDADSLPLKSRSVDCAFSYSVLQHMDKNRVHRSLREIARVLKTDGRCMIQLPNRFGPLSILQQARRSFREARTGSFEMRYWSHGEIAREFEAAGLLETRIHTDGFFSQNAQMCDRDLLTQTGRLIVRASSAGRRIADAASILTRVADSLWVEARSALE